MIRSAHHSVILVLLLFSSLIFGFGAEAASGDAGCLRCHGHGLYRSAKAAKEEIKPVNVQDLKDSAHRGVTCIDCHKDISKTPHPERLGRVDCGFCHEAVQRLFARGIHGECFKKGVKDAPYCTDCHGTHAIYPASDHRSPVSKEGVVSTCAKCHADQKIIAKYSLPSDRYSSYIGSFHGVAMQYGNLTAANCTSCHEVHRILPASDPESSVNKANLAKTCGKCHPQLKGTTLEGKIHVEARKESSLGMYYVREFYKWFIGILMALFVGYIALDIYGRIKRRGRDDGEQR